jgi:hypothetical protein
MKVVVGPGLIAIRRLLLGASPHSDRHQAENTLRLVVIRPELGKASGRQLFFATPRFFFAASGFLLRSTAFFFFAPAPDFSFEAFPFFLFPLSLRFGFEPGALLFL